MNMNIISPETFPGAAFLPELAFKKVLSFLGDNDRKSLRVVCTNWNFMIRTLCLHPNNTYIGMTDDPERTEDENDEEHYEKFYRCLDMNLFEGKYVYYTPATGMRMENILMKHFWSPLLKHMEEFEELVQNVSHLEIKDMYFEDRQSVVAVLKLFKSLEKLSVKYCHLTKESLAKSLQKVNLPSRIKSVHIEHRHNDVYLPGIFTSGQNLEEFSLKIVNCENVLRRERYGATYGFSDVIVSKLRAIVINHQETLKKLRINWQTGETCSRDRLKTISFHSIAAILLPMLTVYRNDNFLSLTELSIELTEINTLHPDFASVLVPFISEQFRKTLRKITLSELTGIFVPANLFLALFPSNKDSLLKKLDINFSLKLTKVGDPRTAEFNRQLLAWEIPRLFMTKLVVDIGPVKVAEEEALIYTDTFPKLFINEYSCLMSQQIKYPNLKEFQLNCHSKVFNSFSIPKMCCQYFNLTTLSIVDGPGFQYDEREEIDSQYNGMSKASITDFDMRFIIEKLGKLQSLKIWANMSSLTDFGIVGQSPEEIRNTESCRYEAEDFILLITQNDIKYEDKSISMGLKDLKYLSLRGVGSTITNLSVSLGLCKLKELKQLEILGDHQITEEYQEILRTVVGYHININ